MNEKAVCTTDGLFFSLTVTKSINSSTFTNLKSNEHEKNYNNFNDAHRII